jgi:hypothetical protein
VSGSGLIYAVIALLWAAVLIPMWLRNHDTTTENRSAERFGQAMRVLSGRAGDQAEDYDDDVAGRADVRRPAVDAPDEPQRAPVRTRPATRPRREVRATREPARREEQAPREAQPRRETQHRRSVPRRPSLARRRARTLLILLGLAAVLTLGTLLGPVPWWAPVFVLVLVVAFVVHLRLQVLRSSTRRRSSVRLQRSSRVREQHSAAPSDSPAADAATAKPAEAKPAEAKPAAAERSWSWRSVFAEDSSRAVVVESKGPVAGEASHPGRDKATAEGEEEWRPNPLPLPTYVTAPKATRPIRVIDLTTPGAWSSGRVIDDESVADEDLLAAEVRSEELDALLEREVAPAAPAAKDADASRRAVGD